MQIDSVEQVLHPYGVGIDCHSKFIAVCVLMTRNLGTALVGGGLDGEVVRHEKSFRTHWAALIEARKWVTELLGDLVIDRSATFVEKPLRYCIESTGTYHLPVLQAWKGEPSIVNPLLAGPTRRKTDVLDARLLAHHSITGVWKPSFIPSVQCQQLRVLWAQRNDSQRAATRHSNRINNIILRFGHTFGADVTMRSSAGEGIIEDLCEGRVPLVPGVCPEGLPEAMRPVIAAMQERMKAAVIETREAAKLAFIFAENCRWPVLDGDIDGKTLFELLQTVPGVGTGTALTWLAEVGDPRRFEHVKQVAAFCGCDPSLKVSAGKITSFSRRAGNMRLHRALVYAAGSVMQQSNNPLSQWGRSIAGRHKKGGYRKATGAVARRIACCLWYVHRLGKPYDGSKYTFGSRVLVEDAPVSTVIPKRYQAVLKDAKITRTQQLADAYTAGQLAVIQGFGDSALQQVKAWIEQTRLAERARKHEYVLKPNAGYHKEMESCQTKESSVRKGSRKRSIPRRRSAVSASQRSVTG